MQDEEKTEDTFEAPVASGALCESGKEYDRELIGRAISRLHQHSGMMVKQLADKLGISRSRFQKLERNTSEVSAELINRVPQIFGFKSLQEMMEKSSEVPVLEMDKVAQSLRKARLKAGVTQRRLADMTDLTQKVIHDLESGRIHPPKSRVNKIFKALGYSSLEEVMNATKDEPEVLKYTRAHARRNFRSAHISDPHCEKKAKTIQR